MLKQANDTPTVTQMPTQMPAAANKNTTPQQKHSQHRANIVTMLNHANTNKHPAQDNDNCYIECKIFQINKQQMDPAPPICNHKQRKTNPQNKKPHDPDTPLS